MRFFSLWSNAVAATGREIMSSPITLYTYWRSSAAYRVRIALNLKGLEWRAVAVNLARDGGEHRLPGYREVNPQALVPALKHGNYAISQSIAIIEFLNERYPQPELLPGDALMRSRNRALSLAIACDIHPLNNLRVLRYLKSELGQNDEAVSRWYGHWVAEGFAAIERELADSGTSGRFSFGDEPSMLDCCLVPQVYNAMRFNCELEPYPTILSINAACLELDAFQRAQPSAQPDAT